MISASIVLFNTSINLIEDVLKSYCPSKDRLLYIIDNSPDKNENYEGLFDSPYIKYLYVGKNLGYGRAHNIAIRRAIKSNSKYHLVLNPDIRFEPSALDALIAYADSDPEIVYVLPKVIYPDGEIQYLCKLLPTPFDLIFRRFLPAIGPVKKMNDRYILKDTGYDRIINPPCLSGCFMFMRTSALAENQIFFDERFFMYCEDFDLMRRLHRVGKTMFYPGVQIIHDHAQGSYKSKKMLLMHIKSACKYFNKYGWFFDKERKNMNKKALKEIF